MMEFALHLSPPPICPRCLRAVQYTRPMWDAKPNMPDPVSCDACNWNGFSIRIRTAPEDAHGLEWVASAQGDGAGE